MKTLALAVLASSLFLPSFAGAAKAAESEAQEPAKKEEAATADKGETRIAPLQAREVIERLKTMRAQLLLEQEYNRLLEARLARQELEIKLSGGKAKSEKEKGEKPDRERPERQRGFEARPLTPPPNLESASEQLVVKAVTVAPFKEAIVTYKGRVYTVRPGDRLGTIEIRDINDSGVVTAGTGGAQKTNMLGQ